MSQDNDKVKENNTSVDTPVLNSENINMVNNDVNTEAPKVKSDVLDTFNNGVNNVKPQELVPPHIRENMVSKATEFLMATAVKSTPMERKITFLRQKGLTDQEIKESINRASMFYQNPISNPPRDHFKSSKYTSSAIETYDSFSGFRSFFWSFTLSATIVYVGYKIYKKYIENWLFGKKKSPLECRMEAVESVVQKCVMMLETRIINSSDLNESKNESSRELDLIRAEIKSIKSLLLNRSQFPPAPVFSSIPEWQLHKNTKPQGELQNHVNGTDTQNVSKQSMFNGSVNTTMNLSPTTSVVDSVNDNQHMLKLLTPHETKSELNSIKSTNVSGQSNDDKDSTDSVDNKQ